jgi:hypothetical protein
MLMRTGKTLLKTCRFSAAVEKKEPQATFKNIPEL